MRSHTKMGIEFVTVCSRLTSLILVFYQVSLPTLCQLLLASLPTQMLHVASPSSYPLPLILLKHGNSVVTHG